MGIWRFAGAFAVVERQSECGSKTAGMHVSQPMNIGVCYGLVFSSDLILYFTIFVTTPLKLEDYNLLFYFQED
jgi:hypothetical protein